MRELRRQNALLLTTEFVLLEVANALSAPVFHVRVSNLIKELHNLSNVQIIPADTSLFADGLKLYDEHADKEWSLTDCISFVVMERENITRAFTSDSHFEQAGFIKLL